jgi:hypothetical protein
MTFTCFRSLLIRDLELHPLPSTVGWHPLLSPPEHSGKGKPTNLGDQLRKRLSNTIHSKVKHSKATVVPNTEECDKTGD